MSDPKQSARFETRFEPGDASNEGTGRRETTTVIWRIVGGGEEIVLSFWSFFAVLGCVVGKL